MFHLFRQMSESDRSEVFSSEEEAEVFFAKLPDSKRVKRARFESEDEENEANNLSKTSTLKKKRAYVESENEEELIEASLIEKATDASNVVTPSGVNVASSEVPSSVGSLIHPVVDLFISSVDTVLEEHKNNLKQLRIKEKASNREFIDSLHHYMFGEGAAASNDRSASPVIVNGFNLMELQAGPEPSKFGRKLGKKMFGENSDCLLTTHMIGHQRSFSEMREKVDEHLEEAFES